MAFSDGWYGPSETWFSTSPPLRTTWSERSPNPRKRSPDWRSKPTAMVSGPGGPVASTAMIPSPAGAMRTAMVRPCGSSVCRVAT